MSQQENTVIVAIVDNDQDYLNGVKEYFELEGIIAIAIFSRSKDTNTLVEEVKVSGAQVVLTGVRNDNNRDDQDLSGIYLAESLTASGIPTIVTSSPQYEEEVKNRNLLFVGKHEGLNTIIAAVRKLATPPRT